MASIDTSNVKGAILPAILAVIIGILFIAVPGAVLFWGMIIIGIFLIILAIVNIKDLGGVDPLSIIMLILGIIMIAAPMLFPTLAQYILGAIFIVVGILADADAWKGEGRDKILGILVGLLFFVMGILLVINVWTIETVLQINGVILIIVAIVEFLKAIKA